MDKPTHEKEAEIEVLALQLYDMENPRPERRINVSKQECINRARRLLLPKQK